jgi:hypothetical protein
MYLIFNFVQCVVSIFTSAFSSPGTTCLTWSGLRLTHVLCCILTHMYRKILSTLLYFAVCCDFRNCNTDFVGGMVVFVIYRFMCVFLFQTLTAAGSADW